MSNSCLSKQKVRNRNTTPLLDSKLLVLRCATREVIVTIATATRAGVKGCHQGGNESGDALSGMWCVRSSLCWWRRCGWNVDDWVVRSVDKLVWG